VRRTQPQTIEKLWVGRADDQGFGKLLILFALQRAGSSGWTRTSNPPVNRSGLLDLLSETDDDQVDWFE